jgi:L-gulonate 3-dehydrogenase
MKIAIVGCGTVGASWAVVFARAGLDVVVYDSSRSAIEAAISYAHQAASSLAEYELLNGQIPAEVCARIKVALSIGDAVHGAEYVQESTPERLSIKQEVYEELANLTPPGAVIASSTSGLPASSFTAGIVRKERCLVAHPINPPHLIPLVEIVPSPWTNAASVQRTISLMKMVGQMPICLSREIPGFVVNRLQSAVLAEAFRLVEDGLCSANDVDAAVAHGLGLRWFFMGPFEAIDLNAQGGVTDYCRKLGPMFNELAKDQADPRQWSVQLINTVERQLRETTSIEQLDQRRAWRDRCLCAFIKAKSEFVN